VFLLSIYTINGFCGYMKAWERQALRARQDLEQKPGNGAEVDFARKAATRDLPHIAVGMFLDVILN
jgi:hypothetical protein